MKKQVLALKSQGKSLRAISKALGLARNTVRSILREPEDPLPKIQEDIKVAEPCKPRFWHAAVDWEVVANTRKAGRTIKQLHVDFGPIGVSYWAFRRALEQHLKILPKPALRLSHKPGEKTYIDYCDGIPLLGRDTEKATKTHLFCGVLPFSGKVYGEFVLNQQLPSFLDSHERMWAYFGGVTPYVVVDNLKSGVSKAHRYDPDVNPTYCEFGNHYGFAVLPARPYTPRDKAAVECAIGVIQKTFFQEVASRIFSSLDELNRAFRLYCDRLNATPMKDYGISRNERFLEEKHQLLPLPETRFVKTEWKTAKVHPDCHIQVLKGFYSVPFIRVGQEVRVRITQNLIEVFTPELEQVCSHSRLFNVGQYATVTDHLPPHAMQTSSFEIRTHLIKARSIGPLTAQLADLLLAKDPRPLRRLRLFQGLSRLARDGSVSPAAIEFGVSQALTYQRYRLAYITDCAKAFEKRGPRPQAVAPHREAEHTHLHGGI